MRTRLPDKGDKDKKINQGWTMKKTQWIMIWFLPVIVIGGLFYPLLGFLVLLMMMFFLPFSIMAGRFWCWNLCPRGAFLDGVMSKFSANRPVPGIFVKMWFRWLVLILLMGYLAWRIWRSGGSIIAIGAVFVGMCILTTAISIILGAITKHRGWCVICPMGLLQEKLKRKK